jgi:hypothetical protein
MFLGLSNGIMDYTHLVYSHICNEMQSKVCILIPCIGGLEGCAKGVGLRCEC